MDTRSQNMPDTMLQRANGEATGPPDAGGRAVIGAGSNSPLPWIPTAAEWTVLRRALDDRASNLDLAIKQIATLTREIAHLERVVARERKFANFDELTGLPNRRLLADRYNQATARGSRQNKQLAMLFLDLDGFNSVNNALGHAIGDEILKQVAARLLADNRASDTVCRYGGDEFIVLLAEIDGEESARAAAAKIHACIAAPFLVGTHTLHISTSIGVSVYPGDGGSFAELLRHADLAMYADKARMPRAAAILATDPISKPGASAANGTAQPGDAGRG